jgi:hypothetical protein
MKTHDDLAKWCAMPKGELQNHIPWCIKKFATFTDSIDNNQYFGHLNEAEYIQYNAVAILMTSFQCNTRAVQKVSSSWSTKWRKHKLPTNNTALLWMVTSPDRDLKWTAELVPALLKFHSILEDPESTLKGLLALVQKIITVCIRQTARISIVKERHQPLM